VAVWLPACLSVCPSMHVSRVSLWLASPPSDGSDYGVRVIRTRFVCGGLLRKTIGIDYNLHLSTGRLPELQDLKQRLTAEGSDAFSAVFMTGSGSTIVCFGDDKPPAFLAEEAYRDVFVAPARLIARRGDGWYEPSSATAITGA
jgi:GHMP kinases C terminal